MTITGNGYGARYEMVSPGRYEVSCWKGEEFGAREFTTTSGLYTLEEAMARVQGWCDEMRANTPPMQATVIGVLTIEARS